MVLLPGGSFQMGDRHDNVTVQPFCMDMTEVTVGAYAACAQCGPAPTTVNWENISDGDRTKWNLFCNGSRRDLSDHPVNCVDLGQSATYCNAQGKRLPTEEEWEWAAGAGKRTYSWATGEPDFQLCWSAIQPRHGTCVVGSFSAGDTPEHIHDLAGNVWEWTTSKYNYDTQDRVTRGGSWGNTLTSDVRAARRLRNTPTKRDAYTGFRCAR